jgi:hypothetical protein
VFVRILMAVFAVSLSRISGSVGRPASKNRFSTRTENFFPYIINDFVHRFILDRTFVDFTVSLLILPFYNVDFNSKMVKSSVKP